MDKLKISVLTAAAILSDKKEKLYATYIRLKALHVGSSIHNYTRRYQEIADTCEISKRKLQADISKLKKLGWISTERETNILRLKSLFKVAQELNGSDFKCYKKHYIKFNDNIPQQLRLIALTENLQQQQHIINSEMIDKEVTNMFGTNLSEKTRKKFRKFAAKKVADNFEFILDQSIMRKRNGLLSYKENPLLTISLQSYAKLIGNRSKTTGKKWIDQLKNLGLISQRKEKVLIKRNVTTDMFRVFLSTIEKNIWAYFLDNGNIYKRTACSYTIL